MKISLIIILLLCSAGVFSQVDAGFKTTSEYFKTHNIALNVLKPPKGFTVYYNCDSMLFLRGNFSDTIKIWTPGLEWAYSLKNFREVMTSRKRTNLIIE
jgi:hypothetical protein